VAADTVWLLAGRSLQGRTFDHIEERKDQGWLRIERLAARSETWRRYI